MAGRPDPAQWACDESTTPGEPACGGVEGPDPDDFEGLRADLLAAGYTVDRLADLLGPMAGAALARGEALPAEQVAEVSTDPAAILLRLWVLGQSVAMAQIRAVLPNGWVHAYDYGLLRVQGQGEGSLVVRDDSEVCGAVDLRPYADERHDWWVVSDLTTLATGYPLPAHHVVGVGGASTTLASWAPRLWASRSLDVGTGSGVQALHLAEHTAYRVLTDTSHRALRLAAVTAALNRVSVDLRHGSLFEPVAGEQFDLIVSNPPFVITPRSGGPSLEYRDGGAVGDDIVVELLTGVGAHLRPGGIATILANWEIGQGRDWRERVSAWAADLGLDALIVQRAEQDVAEYAETWARDAGLRPGDSAYRRWYAESLADFAARGVASVGFGVITVQQPSENRRPWIHLADAPAAVEHPMGPHVLAQLRARSWLAMNTDEEILSVSWTVAPDVTQEQMGIPGQGEPRVIQLRQGSGFGEVRVLTTLTAAVLGACDGELSAHRIVIAVSALLDIDADQARAEVIPELRVWIATGVVR